MELKLVHTGSGVRLKNPSCGLLESAAPEAEEIHFKMMENSQTQQIYDSQTISD